MERRRLLEEQKRRERERAAQRDKDRQREKDRDRERDRERDRDRQRDRESASGGVERRGKKTDDEPAPAPVKVCETLLHWVCFIC